MILTSLISGAIAGGVAKTCIAPLDRTKIHFQITETQFSIKKAVKFLNHTYTNHGIVALWRGNSATMARILPYAGLQYCSHEQFKRLLHVDTNQKKKQNKAKSFLAGSLAGVLSSICTYPLDLARARMAVTQSDNLKLAQVFQLVFKKDGFLGLYAGCLPSLLGIIPYAGATFFTYETAKRKHYEWTGKEEPNHVQRMMFGALAGLIGQSATYPLDVVRRRMQTSETKLGMLDTFKKVISNPRPMKSMYKGLSLNWIKGPISVGISFTTYDFIKKLLTHQ